MIEHEELKNLLHYNPDTGVFTWLPSKGKGSGMRKGVAGTVNFKGYRYIKVAGKSRFAHRLAWFYMTGRWPEDQLDHINGERDDNRWLNLREASNGQNMENIAGPHGKTITGVLGVTFRRSRYEARIQQGNRRFHVGTFKTKEAADAAYREAKRVLHSHNERLLGDADTR